MFALQLGLAGVARADDSVEQLDKRAAAAYKAQDYARAFAASEAAFERAPTAQRLHNMGRVQKDIGNLPRALELYERCLQMARKESNKAATAKCAAGRDRVREELAAQAPKVEPVAPPSEEPTMTTKGVPGGAAPAMPRGDRAGQAPERGSLVSSGSQVEGGASGAGEFPGRARRPGWRLVTGSVAVVLGAGLAGLGAWAMAVNGGCAEGAASPGPGCMKVYTSMDPGAGFLGAGAALVAGGVVLLAVPGKSRTSVSLSLIGARAGVEDVQATDGSLLASQRHSDGL